MKCFVIVWIEWEWESVIESVCLCERERERVCVWERERKRVNISKEIWPIISTHHWGVNLLKNVSRQPVFWLFSFGLSSQSGSKAKPRFCWELFFVLPGTKLSHSSSCQELKTMWDQFRQKWGKIKIILIKISAQNTTRILARQLQLILEVSLFFKSLFWPNLGSFAYFPSQAAP